jgi:glutathione synthase
MGLRVALQMDPMTAINPASDSTLLLGLEAQKRGYTLFHYTPDKLTYNSGNITARGNKVTLHPDPKRFHTMGKEEILDLKTMDVVLLRQDPPFDMAYITTTHILEKLMPATLVANDPASVRDNPEKLFPTLFKKFAPPTLITADVSEIEKFRKQHKDIVIKPLYGHGGHGVFRIAPGDGNLGALLEAMFEKSNTPCVVQKFLPEVKDQERRIILIDGKYAGIVGRIPAAGEIRSNFRVGGTAAKVKPTKKQLEICEAIGPTLKKKGLIFVGLDVIGDWLNEINITSPTGLAPINRLYGEKLEVEIWNAIEARLD